MDYIDCVITWVDGSDRNWRERKSRYSGSVSSFEDDDAERYRDFGTLKYLFRGIEAFMPWVRNVFLVTCGQRPEWVNKDCPRLRLVSHEDYIPAKYLPTFSSHTIELNFHRISGLSESFIYFNDDMFVLRNTRIADFFKDGLPCDTAVLNAFAIEKTDKEFNLLAPINDIAIINRHFSKSETLRKYWFKFFNLRYGTDMLRTVCLSPWIHFTGFYNYHFPYSLRKSVLRELWDAEPDVLDATCSHRFRNANDVNIWLALYWQYASGQFAPRSPNIGCLTSVSDDLAANERVCAHIVKQKSKLIVVNDEIHALSVDEIATVGEDLARAFETILPEKSDFER